MATTAASGERSSGPLVTARIYTDTGAYGLPTISADGLAAIALLRFASIPFSISPGASRSMTNANLLPVVIFENSSTSEPSVCAGLPSLIALFTADLTLPDPNAHLTPFMIAESTAFVTLVTSRFAPARKYELFVNERNYADVWHALVEKQSSFPLNWVLPYLRRRQIKNDLAGRQEESLYFDAGIALAALSTRLGSSKFFYGDKPSVLDAIVFGYLATVLYMPLPNAELRGNIAKYSNLLSFVTRISSEYMKKDGDRLMGEMDGEELVEERRRAVLQEEREEAAEELSEEDKERRKWNNYFLWTSLGMFAMHVLLGNEIEIEMS